MSASVGALLLGNMEGRSFPRAFEREKNSYLEEFCADFEICKNGLKTGISLHRGPVGEPGWSSFAGTYERKEKVYLGSFPGPRGHQDFKSGGHLELW